MAPASRRNWRRSWLIAAGLVGLVLVMGFMVASILGFLTGATSVYPASSLNGAPQWTFVSDRQFALWNITTHFKTHNSLTEVQDWYKNYRCGSDFDGNVLCDLTQVNFLHFYISRAVMLRHLSNTETSARVTTTISFSP